MFIFIGLLVFDSFIQIDLEFSMASFGIYIYFSTEPGRVKYTRDMISYLFQNSPNDSKTTNPTVLQMHIMSMLKASYKGDRQWGRHLVATAMYRNPPSVNFVKQLAARGHAHIQCSMLQVHVESYRPNSRPTNMHFKH